MRPLPRHADRPARLGGARVWVLPRPGVREVGDASSAPDSGPRTRRAAVDSLALASALLGEPVTRSANGRPQRARGDLSIAHAGAWWVMAAVERARVGIDLEPLRERPNALEIARTQFPPREAEALAALAPGARSAAFLRLWCAREAVLKAHGAGLEAGFDTVELTLTKHGVHCVDWRLREFRLPGYVGAVAFGAQSHGRACSRPRATG